MQRLRLMLRVSLVLTTMATLACCSRGPTREPVDHGPQVEAWLAAGPALLLARWLPESDGVVPTTPRGAACADALVCDLARAFFDGRAGRPVFVQQLTLTANGELVARTLRRVDEHGLFPSDYDAQEVQALATQLAAFAGGERWLSELVIGEQGESELLAALRARTPYEPATIAMLEEELVAFADRDARLLAVRSELERAAAELEAVALELDWLLTTGLIRYAIVQHHGNPWHLSREELVAAGLLLPLQEPGEDEDSASVDGVDLRPASRLGVDAAELRAREEQLIRSRVAVTLALVEAEGLEDHLASLVPAHPQYARLQAALAYYRERARAGGWQELTFRQELREGQRGVQVVALRRRLAAEGYHHGDLDDERFDAQLGLDLRRYQETHQLDVNGTTTAATIASLNRSAEERTAQIVLTLQRWRESRVGRDLPDYHVQINVPDFHAELWDDGAPFHRFRVVVGRASRPTAIVQTRTPLFSDTMERIVLNPYWNVPQSIINHELLPAAQDDPEYFERHNYEVRQRGERYFIRQRPGPRNALGRVKFLFPNEYAVYMHDTPSRNLFDRTLRAFSHGCIRVHEPMRLAELLIMRDRDWTLQRTRRFIDQALRRDGQETYVNLERPFPVHIEYYVVRVDDEGRVHFLADIYGEDERRLVDLRPRMTELLAG